jgi:hypothetical protein
LPTGLARACSPHRLAEHPVQASEKISRAPDGHENTKAENARQRCTQIPAAPSNQRKLHAMPQRVDALGAHLHAVAQRENAPCR